MDTLKMLRFSNLPIGKGYKIFTGRSQFILIRIGDAYYPSSFLDDEEEKKYPVVQFKHIINERREPLCEGMVSPDSEQMVIQKGKKMAFCLIEIDETMLTSVFRLKTEVLRKGGEKLVYAPDLSGSPFFFDRKVVSRIIPFQDSSVVVSENDDDVKERMEEETNGKRRKGRNRGGAGKHFKRRNRRR